MKQVLSFKYFILLSTFFFLSISSVNSLEVDRSELSGTGTEAVVFENYNGPHAVIDSIDAIKGIGQSLGMQLSNPSEKSTFGNGQRYSVIHAVDSSEKGKLDADIFIISSYATVDHIVNLRRIISSYLSSAYNYSETDANTLATFITVYNAVYRGKIDSLSNRYKKIVMDNVSAEKVGLALNYSQWPGNSQIIIPLSDPVSGGLSTIDTSIISSDEVISSMREENDKGIDARKDMVNLKEQEAINANENAQNAQKNVTEEQKTLKENQEKLPEVIKEAQEAQKIAEENPEDEVLQQQAQDKVEEVKALEKNIEQNKETINKETVKASEQQQIADKKSTESVKERETIAKDQQKLINETVKNETEPFVYGLRLVNEAKQLSALVKVNAKTGLIINESPVTVLRNRNVFDVGENFVAIAGENIGNGTVKLVLLDKAKMELIAESTEIVAEDSVLVQNENLLYCIISEKKKNYIAKYDTSLHLLAKSKISVKSSTPITVTDNQLCITNESGKITLLNAETLEPISK